MDNGHPYDPEASVFAAVADLERKGFTKGEIADALTEAWSRIVMEHEVNNYGRD